MKSLFKCKTTQAYRIKVLSELLSKNLNTGCFEITKDAICLRMFDEPRNTLVDLELQADNFNLYKFKVKNEDSKNDFDDDTTQPKLCLGLTLNHFHKMLKSIKKKDSLCFNVKNNTQLNIIIIPKENTRKSTSSINIQNIQNIETDLPVGYGKPLVINSSDFQKMTKELSNVGSTNVKISFHNHTVKFIADADGIMQREVCMGETEVIDSDDEDDEECKENSYTATFSTDQFERINKITGLCTDLQIFPGSDELPLMFRSNVGTLGKISIYIKSKEIIQRQEEESDSEYSE